MRLINSIACEKPCASCSEFHVSEQHNMTDVRSVQYTQLNDKRKVN